MDEKGTGMEGDRTSLDATLDDHRECMRIVAEVEACLDDRPDRDGRWMRRMLPRLEAMTDKLRSHFEEEEQAALYREVPEKFPRFAERLERLAAEHSQILASAADLLQHAGKLNHTRIHELREFNAGVQLLVARIRRHEAEENEVVLGAHWQECGEGD
jgi:hemerythrin-like domain-containing protein